MSYVEKVHNESYGLSYRVDLGVCLVASKPLFEFPFVCFFVRSHVRNVCALVRSPVHPFVPELVSAFIRYFVCAIVRSLGYSLLVPSFDRSFVCSFVVLCVPRFVHFCGLLFLNQIICLCEGFFFLSINSFLSYTNVLPDFRIVYDRMMTRTSWMKSLRSLRTPT